jgi:hypothetical protein
VEVVHSDLLFGGVAGEGHGADTLDKILSFAGV